MTNETRTSIRLAAAAFALVAAATSTNAFALDAKPPAKSTLARAKPSTEPNGATVRPIAIRLEGTLSLLSYYSIGITAGYAFHRLFALEGTAAWEGGFTHGIMGRLRIPMTPSSSLSVGLGATLFWVPWKGEYNLRGTYLWFPGEIGYEYREKEGFTFLVGVGARLLTYAKRVDIDGDLCLFCLSDPPRIYPAGRFGIGWAF